MSWFKSKSGDARRRPGVLSNLRFRTKIVLGFVMVLGLSAVSMGVAYLGLMRLSAGIVSYQTVVAETDSARDIDRELASYEVLSRFYAMTGSSSDESAAREAEAALGQVIMAGQMSASDENQPKLKQLSGKFLAVTKLFEQVVQLKGDNAEIGTRQLAGQDEAIRGRLQDIASSPSLEGRARIGAEETAAQYSAMAANVANYVERADPAIGERASGRLQALRTAVAALGSSQPGLSEQVAQVSNQLEAYQAGFDKFVQNATAISALVARMNDSIREISSDGKVLKNTLSSQQQEVSDRTVAIADDTKNFVTWLELGSLVLGGLLAWALGQGISRPMVGMCKAMRELAGGNFDVVLPGLGRKDEIGEMASAVEQFKIEAVARAEREAVERDRQNIASNEARRAELYRFADSFEAAVGGIVSNVSSSANLLESAAGSLTQTVETTQVMSSRVASASEETSTNVQSVASATEELTVSVREIGRQVVDSSRIANEAVEQARQTDGRIANLSRAAQRIGDVVKLITAIAEQTNLLALNATIEAARAGDAGRGFAVVATEVKSLATQTAKATDEISSHILGMQEATQESIVAIKEIGQTIGQISQIATTIASAVEQQGAATQEIARNVQNVAHGTREVASSITEVSAGAGETGAASGKVLNSAQTLAAESTRLREELDRFMATIRAA